MAATDFPPRFFKVFVSHLSSDTMVIPICYYDQFPSLLPKTVILQGPNGCCWNIAMKSKRDELCFGQGWAKFVKDNSLSDGDFLTFVYNGDCIFEVSIYGPDGCKETRSVIEDSNYSVSSENTETSSESEMTNKILRRKRAEEIGEDSDVKEESIYCLSSDEMDTNSDADNTCSEFKMAKSMKKGKTKEEGSDDDSDSDSAYIEAFGRSDSDCDSAYIEAFGRSDSDCSYSSKKKGKQQYISDDSVEPKVVKRAKKVKDKIKHPEAYLDNPDNVYFETTVKKRRSELLVRAQLIKDYCLKFENHVNYIDKYGKVEAKTAKWRDHRVCIKRWFCICERNKLKKDDRILCELLRKGGLVYAIKLHIFRGKDL